MKITLEQQEQYIDDCVKRYGLDLLTKEEAITRIENMGRLVPELRDYADWTINELNGVEQEVDSNMLDGTYN